MTIMAYLEKEKVQFERLQHAEVFTAQEVAATQHVPGRDMVKTVLVKGDSGFALVVLPSIYKINFGKLAKVIGSKKVALASEEEMEKVFPDVQVGAEPPFGNLYGVPTIVEEHLLHEKAIVFQSGTHTDTVRMAYSDFEKLVKPKVGQFGDHI